MYLEKEKSKKQKEFVVGILTVTDEMSRIRICSSEIQIRGSGSVPSGIRDQGSRVRDQGPGIRDQR
jgi:hypothetical protein